MTKPIAEHAEDTHDRKMGAGGGRMQRQIAECDENRYATTLLRKLPFSC